jgi:secondary thiamine-phosphate synthase enzyme
MHRKSTLHHGIGVGQQRRIRTMPEYDAWLEKIAPHDAVSHYQHNCTGEDNADAPIKRQIMGREVVVAVTAGRLDFGTCVQTFYWELDGRRRKRVLVKIIGE